MWVWIVKQILGFALSKYLQGKWQQWKDRKKDVDSKVGAEND